MTKILQKKFVVTAMTAISLLLCFLLGLINLVTFMIDDRRINDVLDILIRSEGSYSPPSFHGERPPFQKFALPDTPSPDNVMGARYFVVFFGEDGTVVHTDVSHIYAVTAEEAREIAAHIRAGSAVSGRYEQFRYRVSDSPGRNRESGSFVIFLDVSTMQGFRWTVLLVSCVGGLLCWFTMLLLVILLSKRAIYPIAQNMEKQKQFVTNAGHEIKTPLAIILANTDAMELHNGKNKWSQNIRAQTVRLNGLMQNLLTLAKMDESGDGFPMSEFSAYLLMEETLDLFRETAEEKGITLQTELATDIMLRANRESIMQLVSILLDNATKYTPVNGNITVSLKKSDRQAVLQVKNTCEEPPEEDLEKMFDRFYRGDTARTQSRGGYGIGLSAARAITEAHGGTITASYEKKTMVMTFTVKL